MAANAVDAVTQGMKDMTGMGVGAADVAESVTWSTTGLGAYAVDAVIQGIKDMTGMGVGAADVEIAAIQATTGAPMYFKGRKSANVAGH
jgi:hypothetical protein